MKYNRFYLLLHTRENKNDYSFLKLWENLLVQNSKFGRILFCHFVPDRFLVKVFFVHFLGFAELNGIDCSISNKISLSHARSLSLPYTTSHTPRHGHVKDLKKYRRNEQ